MKPFSSKPMKKNSKKDLQKVGVCAKITNVKDIMIDYAKKQGFIEMQKYLSEIK